MRLKKPSEKPKTSAQRQTNGAEDFMKIVVIHSPRFLSPWLARIFGLKLK